MLKNFTLLFICLLINATLLYAQTETGTLQGKVYTSDGKPALGVTVTLANTSYCTATQFSGEFKLNARPGRYQLRITDIGSSTIQIPVEIKNGETTTIADIRLEVNAIELKDVVVTGQFAPQSLKNSVYLVRTISNEQIRLRNATKIQEVLNDQLGVRFSNDLTLGTSDVSLMGVSGQRVKILLDGVPLLDRGDTRESLNQIDINMIDHIEIVEGPMSVNYGTDALGGVINLITKKDNGGQTIRAYGRVQEETAGKEYSGLEGSGTHQENLGINWQRNGWRAGGNFTRNNFDGAQLGWMPKEQYLGSATAGYGNSNINIWYRFDGEDETLKNNGTPNLNTNIRIDQHYMSNRWMHQLQAEWKLNSRLTLTGAASYTDYSRRTQTTSLDLVTGDRRLTLGTGEQDKSVFDTKFFRGTAQYKLSNNVSLQPGVELNLTGSSGARIAGSPTINDYAFFLSSEIKLGDKVNIRPGARFIHNSVYNAPPFIPALNAKVILSKTLDLRAAYARGFRSPALRELYFDFFDASHSIRGNQNLKAEYSNSFNTSLAWQGLNRGALSIRTALSGFYNDFNDFIALGFDPSNPSITTYINIDKYKTTGGSLDNTVLYKNLQAKVGFAYIGVYNRFEKQDANLPGLTWYPEVNTNLLYHFKKIKTDVSLYYKFNGTRPTYESTIVDGETVIHLARRAAYQTADMTINKILNNHLTLAGGVKNLFNVTNVNNTSVDTGGAHSTGGPVPIGYGRSYFLGINFQFSKY